MNKYLIGIAGALGLFWLLRKTTAGNQLKYSFRGIDLIKRTIGIELINPTNTPLNFSAVVADVLLNGNNIGLIDFRQKTTIEPNGSKVINIPIKLNPIGLASFALSKVRTFKTLAFDGTLNAEKFSLPFKEVINFGNTQQA